MKTIGIIAEYNPFHNGHLYHIQKIKEMYSDSLIILVMSGEVTERGEVSVLNKWDKTKLALNYGIDLVVELPYLFASQSADTFAYGALKILNALKVDTIVFGSELDDTDLLYQCAKVSLSDEYEKRIRLLLDDGLNYPTALSKALKDMIGTDISSPNDLLGLSYIKEIIKHNYPIKAISIKRTNQYHSEELTGQISSATSIRKSLKNGEDVSLAIPYDIKEYIDKPIFLSDYFPFIKYRIMSEDDLSKYETVDENIAHRLKDKITISDTLDDFLGKVKTKYYTYNRLMRMCSHILFGLTKEENKNKENIYIRLLGFNSKGRTYLNKIKKDLNLPLITNYSNAKNIDLSLDLRVIRILSMLKGNNFLDNEIKHKPIKYEKKEE